MMRKYIYMRSGTSVCVWTPYQPAMTNGIVIIDRMPTATIEAKSRFIVMM